MIRDRQAVFSVNKTDSYDITVIFVKSGVKHQKTKNLHETLYMYVAVLGVQIHVIRWSIALLI